MLGCDGGWGVTGLGYDEGWGVTGLGCDGAGV